MRRKDGERPIRVLLAHRSPLFLEGARALLDAAAGLAVVGTAADGASAILRADELRPRALVFDARLGEADTAGVARLLRRAAPRAALVALVGEEDAELARPLWAAGVRGFVPFTASADELAGAVRAVAAGKAAILDLRAATVLARPALPLTPRQATVLRLLAAGRRNREIAEVLGVEERTAAYHVAGLMARLAARTRAEAVYKARLAGLPIDPAPTLLT